ncbi:MAG: HAD family hydrolase [Spirochaetes bacterium RBG_16_49_21]|nr:MAG: HAD family hydrolase [Spirochaetes bacterium RBG_16_49_21]
MKYRALLFDMDGTLLDTLQDIADSMNAVLKGYGFPVHPAYKYKKFVGGGMDMLARRVLPEDRFEERLVPDLAEKMNAEYSMRWDKNTRLYPGVDTMLDNLRQRGVRLSLLSNKPDLFTKMIYERYLAKWEFEIVMGACPGVPKKPDPYAALLIAQQMGLAPEQFIYLGDSDTDMKTAIAAGMHPVGALWGFRDAEELRANGALELLERPEELAGLLED